MNLDKPAKAVRRGRRRHRIDRLVKIAVAPLLGPIAVGRRSRGSVCLQRFEPLSVRMRDIEGIEWIAS
jgi:hypothetical protein